MYKVTVVAVNETAEVEVKAKYCVLDNSNNLVLVDRLENMAEPIAIFPAGRWVFAEQA